MRAYSGIGSHLIPTPTLGSALEAEFLKQEKIEVSKIIFERVPRPDETLWATGATATVRHGWTTSSRSHRAKYSLTRGWRENTLSALELIYTVNPKAEKEVVIDIIPEHTGQLQYPIIGGQYWDMTTIVTMKLKTLANGKVISNNEFKGESKDVVWAGGAVTFPSKSEVETNLENAYRDMWGKFLKEKGN